VRRLVVGLVVLVSLETSALLWLGMEHRVLAVRVEALAGLLQGVEREVQMDTDDQESATELLDQLRDVLRSKQRAPRTGGSSL
jgi:hypothetical protein